MKLRVKETNETSSRVALATHLTDCRMRVDIRAFSPLIVDEPPHHGGQDEGPSPLEYVTAGLAACQTVTIAKIAQAMRFAFSGLTVQAETDVGWQQSRLSTAMVPRFAACRLHVSMKTDEAPGRIETMKALVNERCPASDLFEKAGLIPEIRWNFQRSED